VWTRLFTVNSMGTKIAFEIDDTGRESGNESAVPDDVS
jgi:hypothetical protein